MRVNQTQSIPLNCKYIAILAKGYILDAGQNFLLDIVNDIIQIFAGSDQPAKGFKMLDKCYLGKVFTDLIGLGPGIAIKPFTGVSGNGNHITDDEFALGILHID